jgi:hypothetical protein
MTNVPESEGQTPEDDIGAIYGKPVSEEPIPGALTKREFQPWHHPVKQIVRDNQWAELTRRLLSGRREASAVLHYFTLPGLDLLDVRVLADVCEPLGVIIKYFGFDAGIGADEEASGQEARWITAESALRQAGRITSDAIILPDRLEDIALHGSQASDQLGRQRAFDVVNIDACDHLAYRPKGRDRNTFDALSALLEHQMARARVPWLLFLTTRINPGLAGQPGIKFQKAIAENLDLSPVTFGEALTKAVEADGSKIAAALAEIWTTHDSKFIKLYTIGIGKFLLQFFHGQPNLPADVELVSAYCYRVHHDEPDMLALAFRISPEELRVFSPSVGGAAPIPTLEATRAAQIAKRAEKLWDLDKALEEQSLLQKAVERTETLLSSANYDIEAWKDWLVKHPRRPVQTYRE